MKQSCINENLMNQFINGSLSEEKKESIEQHLLFCNECLDDYVLAKMMSHNAESWKSEPVPDDVAQTVLKKVRFGQEVRWFAKIIDN